MNRCKKVQTPHSKLQEQLSLRAAIFDETPKKQPWVYDHEAPRRAPASAEASGECEFGHVSASLSTSTFLSTFENI